MSSAEFMQWIAYYSLEPFGATRDNLHSAMIASTIANVHRGKGKKAIPPKDFMLKTELDKPKASFDEFYAFLSAHAVEKRK